MLSVVCGQRQEQRRTPEVTLQKIHSTKLLSQKKNVKESQAHRVDNLKILANFYIFASRLRTPVLRRLAKGVRYAIHLSQHLPSRAYVRACLIIHVESLCSYSRFFSARKSLPLSQ